MRVTASSQSTWTAQDADKVIDGSAGGGLNARTRQWAAVSGKAGSWVQLDFPAPTAINGVVLFGRPELADRITGGTLVLCDGSTVATCASEVLAALTAPVPDG